MIHDQNHIIQIQLRHEDKKHKNKKAGYEHMDNCPMITMFDISTPIKRFTINTSTIWLNQKEHGHVSH
jgi:hypothetical protein